MHIQCEVVTFGETMVLFSSEQYYPLEYVTHFQKQIGGAESNFAIGLQRLGHAVGWFSKLGNDPFGRYMLQTIRGEGVDTSRCLFTDEAPTAVFFKEKKSPTHFNVYYYRRNSAASRMTPDDLDADYIGRAKILHISGITPALSASCRDTVYRAVDIAKKHGVKVSFDPNIRLKLWSAEEARPVLTDLIQKADIILPGMDEGELLTGKKTPEEVVQALKTRDDQTFVVKLGSEGAYYDHQGECGYVPGFPAEMVDPVGAGDGFAAGIISGFLHEEPIRDAVRKANAIGALVIGVNGDMEGLPRKEEVDALLNDTQRRDVHR